MTSVDRRFFRPGWIFGHVLVILAVLTCLRLGWWQWDRGQAAGGDAQNIGYALLWPAFGAAFIYMWLRFLLLERAGKDDAEEVSEPAESQDQESSVAQADQPAEFDLDPDEQSVGIVGDETYDDPQLIAYNRALAALAEEDQRRAQ